MKDIILVDNLIHSFGLQIDNGIPILEYLKGKEDKELLGLENTLIEMAELEDVRDYLKSKLDLRRNLLIREEEFLVVPEESQQRLKTIKL